MAEIIESTGTIVPDRTPEIIATEIRMIEASVSRTMLQGAVEIGNRLQEIKETLPHGEWEAWCGQNLNYSKRKAENFMRIATEYGDENSPYFKAISKTQISADLNISNALSLLKVPEDEVENFVENHDLSKTTVKELEEEIRVLKENLKTAEEDRDAMAEDLENKDEKLSEAIKELDKVSAEADFTEKEKAELLERIESLQKELTDQTEVAVEDERVEALRKELEKAAEKLEKAKSKEKTLKEELDAANKNTEEAVKRALEEELERQKEQQEQLKKEAEEAARADVAEQLQQLEQERDKQKEKMEAMEKRLAAASDDTMIRLRIMTQKLQEDLKEIRELMQGISEETAGKLKPAFLQIFQTYEDLTK